MNKFEHFLSRISGKNITKKANGVTKTERIMKDIADKMDSEAWGSFENVSCEAVYLAVPKKYGVVITPDTIGNTSSVLFEGDSNSYVILSGIHDPVADNQAATKGYVDPRLLPSVTSADAGKTLVVDSNGHWVLST